MGIELDIKNKTIAWWDFLEPSGDCLDEKYGRRLTAYGTITYHGDSIEPSGAAGGYLVNVDKKVQFPPGDWSMVIWADFQNWGAIYDFVIPLVNKEWDETLGEPEVVVNYRTNLGNEQISISIGEDGDWNTLITAITPPVVADITCMILRWHSNDQLLDMQHNTDIANNIVLSQLMNMAHEQNTASPLVVFALDRDGNGAGAFETRMGQLAIFNGILSQAEGQFIFNAGAGIHYSDLTETVPVEEVCAKEIECCPPDVFAYHADDTEVVARARNFLGHAPPGENKCLDIVNITVTPSDTFCVHFPLIVGLVADVPAATIVYTLDGTDPDPDLTGTTLLYTGPIEIANPFTIVRYRAVVAGCPDYVVQQLAFTHCDLFDFAWVCTTDDYVGNRNVWVPDGNPDHNWNLKFDFDVFNYRVDRVEIIELDENMEFTTGHAWSSAALIYPYATDPTVSFEAYPLWVQEAGGPPVPIVTAYVDTIGNYTGTHEWEMAGMLIAAPPADHYFQIKVVTEFGVMQAIIEAGACTPPPDICADIPIVATPHCDTDDCEHHVDLSFTIPAGSEGGTYSIYRVRNCIDPSEKVLIFSGVGAIGANTFVDTGLPARCQVRYILDYEYLSGCTGSHENTVTTLGCPQITVDVDLEEVDPTQNLVITVFSRYFEAGTGSCGATIDLLLNGAPWIAGIPINTTHQETTNVIAAITGINTIRAVACNTCGEVAAEVTFEKLGAATCAAEGPLNLLVDISGFAGVSEDFVCVHDAGAPEWDGSIGSAYLGSCTWEIVTASAWLTNDGGNEFTVAPVLLFAASVEILAAPGDLCGSGSTIANCYVLRIFGCCCNGETGMGGVIWQGYKRYGSHADGTYTFVKTMCVNGGAKYTADLDGPSTIGVDDAT